MVNSAASRYTELIKKWSVDLGFDSVGISKARFLEEEAQHLEDWLHAGYHAGMSYMANHFDMRLDPRILVPGAKSVISLTFNYFPTEIQSPEVPKLSKYAYGEDYHFVIKRKLFALIELIKENIGEVNGRAFVDSAPVMESIWARESGLGWLGKHTLVLSKKKGSFFFLSELIIDLDLEYDHPVTDHCGDCTKCIDACPTDAIFKNGILDAGRCISYATIELKEETIPDLFKGNMEGWYFGCDICQDVCPWNRFSKPHQEPAFGPTKGLLEKDKKDWLEITEDIFKQQLKISPLKRSGWKGIQRNIKFTGIQKNGISTFTQGNH